MFMGQYDYAVDAKGRLNFPAKFRDGMGETFIVTRWLDHCLAAFPPEEFEKVAQRIAEKGMVKGRNVSRMLYSSAVEVTPDKQGRIQLPAKLREYANLDHDVSVIGNRNFAEIWNTQDWEARQAESDEDFTAAMEDLGYRVKDVSDHEHKELSVQEVLYVFERAYLNNKTPLNVPEAHFTQNPDSTITAHITVANGSNAPVTCDAVGNGRLDAVANAIEQTTGMHFTLVHYSEHALDNDTDSRACCYVGLKWASGKETWGCGTHTDIIVAGIRALVSAINNQ